MNGTFLGIPDSEDYINVHRSVRFGSVMSVKRNEKVQKRVVSCAQREPYNPGKERFANSCSK